MLTIPEEPDRPVCSIHGALKWGYFTDTKKGPRWVSFVFDEGGKLDPHICDDPDPSPVRWKPDPVIAERAARGNALVRRVLSGDNPFTEEEARDA